MRALFSSFFSLIFAALATIVLTAGTPPRVTDLPVSDKIFSISTGPWVDASVSVGISWACDL